MRLLPIGYEDFLASIGKLALVAAMASAMLLLSRASNGDPLSRRCQRRSWKAKS
jgi:hypothetical protein